MNKWLTLLGVGEDGAVGLSTAAQALLAEAEIVVGAPRHLDSLANDCRAERQAWASPLSASIERILGWRGRPVVVLATGDPMHFGIGATLAKRIAREEMQVLPAPSAFSLAAARLGWVLQDVECLSLHGRPAALVQPLIRPGARILALTGGAATVHEVAAILVARGFGDSRLTVLEQMGGAAERVTAFAAKDSDQHDFADFHTLALDCVAGPAACVLARVPGLPDEAFQHDGQMTKREVRAVTLSSLAPLPGELLWDVGAGCGSVAIEWMRAARGAAAIAFERHPQRLAMIAANATALGTPGLEIVAGGAPAVLAGQRPPDAIFLGGAVSDPEVVEACWEALPAGGRLVANAVTLEGQAAVIAHQERLGGEILRLEVSLAAQVGRLRALRPRMAVTQWRAFKS